MKLRSRAAPLIHEEDTQKTRDEIASIQATGADVFRPTRFQVKVGHFNYYLTTGTISIDGVGNHTEEGVKAFVRLIR